MLVLCSVQSVTSSRQALVHARRSLSAQGWCVACLDVYIYIHTYAHTNKHTYFYRYKLWRWFFKSVSKNGLCVGRILKVRLFPGLAWCSGVSTSSGAFYQLPENSCAEQFSSLLELVTRSQWRSLVPEVRSLHPQSGHIRLMRVTGYSSKSAASYNTTAAGARVGGSIIKMKQKRRLCSSREREARLQFLGFVSLDIIPGL